MNIVVTVKAVPETLKFDRETKRIERSGVKTILNPLDLIASEEARKLRVKTGGTLTAVSMAPPDKGEVLKELFKYGFDRVILLSDRIFGGADTLATAYVLSAGIRKFVKDFDVIFQGDYSLDGSTGQLGGELAAMLGIPYLSHVVKIQGNIVSRLTELNVEEFSVKFPAVLSVESRANNGVTTDLFALLKSEDKEVETYTNNELGADVDRCGLSGSKTTVLSLVQNEIEANSNLVKENAGKEVVEFLSKAGVL